MKKRLLSLLLAAVMCMGLLPTSAMASENLAEDVQAAASDVAVYSGPTVITSADDLAALAEAVNGGDGCEGMTITLATDITLTGEWTPIGTSANPFKGTFDGQGHTVSGLSITGDGAYSYQGLFGNNAGTIQNLTVSGTLSINTSEMNAYSGGIVGYNTGTIANCANDVAVTVTGSWSGYYVGGITGYNGGTINGCVNRGAVTGTTAVGGIAGQQSGGSAAVNNCYNTATITNTGNHTGGIVGLQSGGDVTNCYNVGTISGSSNANSIIGTKRGHAPQNCFFLEGGTDSNATSKTSDELKALASTLGEAFADDVNNINDGYPVLAWQNAEKEVSPDLVIATVEQFKAFAGAVNGGENYEGKLIALAANLNLGGKEWAPIGSSGSISFKGTFDGKYHTISGLSINATAANVGLFGYLGSTGIVRNLAVSGTITTNKGTVGGIVGYNAGTIENCLNSVHVDGSSGNQTSCFGGIAGDNYKGTIIGCANVGNIIGIGAVGGIAGRNASATIENCYNLGSVSGDSSYISGFAGGIAGQMRNMGSPAAAMTNCYSAGDVLDGKTIGAVIGSYSAGTVENCYYLSKNSVSDSNATAKTSDELKALADILGSAFETNDGGYPALTWEKNIDASAPVGPVFPEASDVSARLSGYIRAAIDAKKVAEKVPEGTGLLSTYTVSDTATDWIAVAMGRYGYQDGDTYTFLYDDGSGYTDYIAAMKAYVTNKYAENNGLLHDKKATEWQRLILAVNAIGGDPTDFGTYNGNPVNLVNDGTYNHANPGWQGINGSIFGLIALDSKDYAVPADAVTTREKFIKDILALQLTDGVNGHEMGGWALSGAASDPDITAMAIQALAPYYNSETAYTYTNKAQNKEMTQSVRQAVNAALDKLGAIQRSDGDYASWGTVNVESTAQVLLALCTLGIDPAHDARFIKNGKTLLDGILKYRLSGGGFTHSFTADSNNPDADPGVYNYMATDQASYAMVAYWRFENGMRTLYDMRDEWSGSGRAAIDAAIAAIRAVPGPSDIGYKAALKSALAEFEKVPENERRYVSNYNDLATAIEIVGGRGALDTTDKYPVSMAITTPPTKTAYIEGETFDPAGMVVTLTYNDGSTETVTDYTMRPTGELIISVTEIAISYNGFTVTQEITVNEQAPWEGTGTEQSPYLIQSLTDLQALKDWVDPRNKSTFGVYFKMTANIDTSSVSDWASIGSAHAFQGVFDGDGYYLTNYRSSDGGVFGTVSGTIRNFGVASGSITQNNNSGNRAVIVNTLSNGKVLNCWNAADITFRGGYAGAIVGDCRYGTDNLIEGCYNLGNIYGPNTSEPLGGIVGYLGRTGNGSTTVTISNCYNRGNIVSIGDAGGIVGKNQADLTMINCYNTGKITCNATNTNAKAQIGSLVGSLYGTRTITNCYYLEDNIEIGNADAATTTEVGESKTADGMKSADFLTALGSGYKADRETDPINEGYPVLAWQEFPVPQVTTVTVTFSVTPAGAQIVVKDAGNNTVSANADGTYTLTSGATYTYTVSANGYVTANGSITATEDQTVTVTLQSSGSGPVAPSDPLKEHREKALASLKKQYDKFNREDYSAENWAILEAAYEKGVADIKAAQPAGAPYPENNIIKALNAAIAAMQAVAPDRTSKVTVAVSVDANTLGLGYLVKPTLVEVDNHAKASVVLTDLLRKNGYTWTITGTIDEGFYLAGISPVTQTTATVAPFIVSAIGGESYIMYSDRNDTKLGEFDYYNTSGWMYSVDGSFPGVGASGWGMTQGEVMRWQFTVYGLGADLNADNSGWGAASIIPTLGNKDALTWDVARLRSRYSDDVLEANAAYQSAMEVLTDPTATSSQIQKAKNDLANANFDTKPVQPILPPSDNGNTGSSATVDSTPTVTDNTAAVVLDKAQMDQALESAGKNGTLVIDAGADEKVDTVTVSIPAGSMADAAAAEASVRIQSAIGSVTLPASSLSALPNSGTVQVGVTLNDQAGTVKATVAVDGKTMLDLPFKFSFAIPDAVNSGTDSAAQSSLVAVLVAADGSETVLQKSIVQDGAVYTQLAGSAEVTVRSNARTFADVTGHDWYYDCVAFAASHDLFQGVGGNSFDPSGTMTRAMLATVLHRLENTAKTNAADVFGDVPAGRWYSDAVRWASENGIVNGYSEGVFAPNDSITREQLATMLYRYAGILGMDVSAKGDMNGFTDAGSVSGWASEAMKWAVGAGLLQGKGHGVLDPRGTATRAEVAAVLQRMVGLMVL